MDLRLLEIFCHVYEERSFSKAAERLHLSQPTVSSHVKTLELQVGTTLLDRLGREVTPTRAGTLLYEHGRRIIEAKRLLAQQMDRYLNRLEGELLIGASTIPGEYLLVPLIGEFRAAFPGVEVKLLIRDSAEVLEGVEAGRLEVGFAGAKRALESDLHFQDFAVDQLVLVAPARSKWDAAAEIGFEQLCREPLVVREPGSGTRMIFERRLAELGLDPGALQVAAEMGSTAAVKRAVQSGLGMAVISHLAVEDEVRAERMKVIDIREVGRLERHFYVVTHRRRARSALCDAWLSWLAARPDGAGLPTPKRANARAAKALKKSI
jgi:DNA-binding transcriptional LysR family regulator